MPACAGLLEPRGLVLEQLKSTFNAQKFIPKPTWSICSLEMCTAARNCEKIKDPGQFLGIKVV